jgi:hypothetical protein
MHRVQLNLAMTHSRSWRCKATALAAVAGQGWVKAGFIGTGPESFYLTLSPFRFRLPKNHLP